MYIQCTFRITSCVPYYLDDNALLECGVAIHLLDHGMHLLEVQRQDLLMDGLAAGGREGGERKGGFNQTDSHSESQADREKFTSETGRQPDRRLDVQTVSPAVR